MITFQEYNAASPNILFADNITQAIWKSWISEVNADLSPISLYNARSVDNVIENGYIYVANLSQNKVLKLTEQRGNYKEASINSPLFVSTINLTSGKTLVDGGVWVLNNDGELKKYDKELALMATVSGFSNKSFISSDVNGNCAIADNILERILVVNGSGDVISSIGYDEFDLPIDETNEIIQIKFDINSDLFVLSGSYLYKVSTSSSYEMSVTYKYDISTLISLLGYRVSDMDIDLQPGTFIADDSSSSFSDDSAKRQDVYVSCGDYTNIMILNFDSSCVLVRQKQFASQEYPYVMRVSKGRFSNHIGVLADANKFDEPLFPWESSSSSESSSSIEPTNVFLTNRDSTELSKLDLNTFNVDFYGNHVVLGSMAVAYNPNNNRIYYVSEITDEIYYYDLTSKVNVYVSAAPSINIDRIAISTDATKLWLSKDSTLWVCNIANGTVLNTITLKSSTLASIEQYGGIEIHPTNGHFYLASGQAIYRGNVSAINVSDPIVYITKIANKPLSSNYITDITFAESGEMFISDYQSATSSNIYMVNYKDAIITYKVVATLNQLVDAMGSGTGV